MESQEGQNSNLYRSSGKLLLRSWLGKARRSCGCGVLFFGEAKAFTISVPKSLFEPVSTETLLYSKLPPTSFHYDLSPIQDIQSRPGFSASGLTYVAYVDLLTINLFELDQSTFVYMPPIKKDKSLYSFNSQRAHSMNFLFCGNVHTELEGSVGSDWETHIFRPLVTCTLCLLRKAFQGRFGTLTLFRLLQAGKNTSFVTALKHLSQTNLLSSQVTPSPLDSTGRELYSFIPDPSKMNILAQSQYLIFPVESLDLYCNWEKGLRDEDDFPHVSIVVLFYPLLIDNEFW